MYFWVLDFERIAKWSMNWLMNPCLEKNDKIFNFSSKGLRNQYKDSHKS